MKNWFKKYSMIFAMLTAVSGVGISVMPYFEAYLEQWQVGALMSFFGICTAVGRVIPQNLED